MSKRSVFTSVTPLPAYISREAAVESLHRHAEMIELNPLVIKYEQTKPPKNASADEYHCIWYELTDKVHYLPGGLLSGNVTYKACFHDLPAGLQTHVYAPAGLDIKEKWSVGGNMPGEPREPVELGLTGAPREGLYLREDVDMRCNMFMTSFVKGTLQKAHGVLVDRLIYKADLLKQKADTARNPSQIPSTVTSPVASLYRDSQASRLSYISNEPHSGGAHTPISSPQGNNPPHPAVSPYGPSVPAQNRPIIEIDGTALHPHEGVDKGGSKAPIDGITTKTSDSKPPPEPQRYELA